jgi:hypothetical protein
VNVWDINCDRCGSRCVLGRILARASALLVMREWLVGCAAGLGNDAEDAAATRQLVRESGGGGVSRASPSAPAFIRGRCWCSCRWDCPECPSCPCPPRTSGRGK